MSTLTIISVSIPDRLLKELDDSVEKRGFANRSEALRQAIRFFVEEQRSLEEVEGEIIAIITVVYEKAAKSNRMLTLQHEWGSIVLTFLHTHVDKRSCLEVMVARGFMQAIRKLVNAMRANEQVRQVKVTIIGVPQ
ncbi:TPA: nickel-responsive transcriptional regulator NikR [Candidatus Bathyarchaeota archaeon]|nr:nickel-responsive transcriptional regulator NikR [Candidatus Bathyarchaeota archaeon]